LSRKLKYPTSFALQSARNILASFGTFGYDASDVSRAVTESATGRFSFWDALLLSAAERHGIRFLVSGDMADGMRLGRIEVVQAFTDGQISPRAAKALGMH
jgi:predicted nucleic acid-binding protein